MKTELIKFVIKSENGKVLSKSNTWIDPLIDPEYIFYHDDYFIAQQDLDLVKKIFTDDINPEIRSMLITYDFDWE